MAKRARGSRAIDAGKIMRVILGGLAALALSTNAWSADLLRGSTPAFGETRSYNWAGFYIGGSAGYASSSINMTETARGLISGLTANSFLNGTTADGTERNVSEWLTLPRQTDTGATFGGFVGWNSQWGDIVLGTELNYTRYSLSAAASDSVSRFFVEDLFRFSTTVTGSASATLIDYVGLRARAGYAWGWLLPYATAGIAIGRANYNATVSVGYPTPIDVTPPQVPPLPPRIPPSAFFDSTSIARSNVFSVGYTLGAGIDIGLMPGVFVRAEYEFVQFARFGGISAQVQNARVGAAIKF